MEEDNETKEVMRNYVLIGVDDLIVLKNQIINSNNLIIQQMNAIQAEVKLVVNELEILKFKVEKLT